MNTEAIARAFGIPVAGSDYPAGATVRIAFGSFNFDAVPKPACVRLWDLGASAPVAGSEKCFVVSAASSPTDPSGATFETDPFVLSPAPSTYAIQSMGADAGSVAITGPFLRVDW